MRCGIVVGYLGANTTNENYTMVSASFLNVGSEKQFSLADIKAGGYTNSYLKGVAWMGGCKGGAFELRVLKDDGNPSATYYWVDATTGTKTKSTVWTPGWYTYDSELKDYVIMADETVKAIKFDLGQAFWIAGSGYNLVSAGTVAPKNMEFKTNESNYTAVGNGMPIDYTLGDLYANGYTNSYLKGVAWMGGCKGGAFELRVLKNDGNPLVTYYWIDATTGTKTKSTVWDPGWYTYDSELKDYVKIPDKEVAEIKIPAGMGFWIAGSGYNLVVPTPLAEEKPVE